jgi:hypothetical protein
MAYWNKVGDIVDNQQKTEVEQAVSIVFYYVHAQRISQWNNCIEIKPRISSEAGR